MVSYSGFVLATDVNYNNSNSGLVATNIQEAADEIDTNRSYFCAGFLTDPDFTDNEDNTVTMGSADVILYDNPNHTGKLKKYTLSSAVLTLTDTIPYVIVAKYNNGTPIYALEDNFFNINMSNETSIRGIMRNGDVREGAPTLYGLGVPSLLNAKHIFSEGVIRESGLVLSEDTDLEVKMTTGRIWFGAGLEVLADFASKTDSMHLWYHVSEVWTEGGEINAYNNTQYDDGSDLQDLTVNRWTVNYVYRGTLRNEASGLTETHLILGSGDYVSESLALADIPPVPLDLPVFLRFGSVLVGRIIVQKSAASGTVQQIASCGGFN